MSRKRPGDDPGRRRLFRAAILISYDHARVHGNARSFNVLYEVLFRSLPVAVALIDGELCVHDASDAYPAFVGADPAAARSGPLRVDFPDAAMAVAAREAVRTSGRFDAATRGRSIRLAIHALPAADPPMALALLTEAAAEDLYAELCASIRTIKHDINNPLTGALGNINLLLRRSDLDEKSRRRLTTAEQELKRIGQIVVRLAGLAPAGPSPRD